MQFLIYCIFACLMQCCHATGGLCDLTARLPELFLKRDGHHPGDLWRLTLTQIRTLVEALGQAQGSAPAQTQTQTQAGKGKGTDKGTSKGTGQGTLQSFILRHRQKHKLKAQACTKVPAKA